MSRVPLLILAWLIAVGVDAAEITYFPKEPKVGAVGRFLVEAELPTNTSFIWRSLKPGSQDFETIPGATTRRLDASLVTGGEWIIEVEAIYKNEAGNVDVSRVYRVLVPVVSSSAAIEEANGSKLTTAERIQRNATVEAQRAKIQANDAKLTAQRMLERAVQSGDPLDFSDAARAANTASAAHRDAADKQKASADAARDSFGVRDTIVSLITTRQFQSPANVDSDFFNNASIMSTAFKKAASSGEAALSAQPTSDAKAIQLAVLLTLQNEVNAAFPQASIQLRDQVWRKFFGNALSVAHNTIGRSEHWARLETPSNVILLYQEIGSAIDEAIRTEHEFIANYQTVQQFNNANSSLGGIRSNRFLKRCLTGL